MPRRSWLDEVNATSVFLTNKKVLNVPVTLLASPIYYCPDVKINKIYFCISLA